MSVVSGLGMSLLVGVGIIAGWMNVMAGGGSLLTVPALLFFGLPGTVANGTNRIAILAENIVATATFFRYGVFELRPSLSLAAAAIPGALIGAHFGVQLSGEWFEWVLAFVMLGVMALMFAQKPVSDEGPGCSDPMQIRNLGLGVFLMFGAGLWGGFIQVGVGFILMPILHRVLGMNLVQVNAYKVVIILPYTIVALFVFARQGEVAWLAGTALAFGNAIGGWLGAHTNIAKGESLIRPTLFIVLIVIVVKLLLF